MDGKVRIYRFETINLRSQSVIDDHKLRDRSPLRLDTHPSSMRLTPQTSTNQL